MSVVRCCVGAAEGEEEGGADHYTGGCNTLDVVEVSSQTEEDARRSV